MEAAECGSLFVTSRLSLLGTNMTFFEMEEGFLPVFMDQRCE